ncbi:MAG: isocitrate lyase/phosphoenolpyruvate mutase family protein [Deltaproteobacteria bacterium]|nr:MAG: isocitrate lyase/phosphoenolpyruvate mutase family protein [Deltaproteobacteria bacterium]
MDPKIAAFRALHEKGCFVLPNPWDPGSAVYLEHLGFKALATTSAGFAFSQALPDAGVPLERMLRHLEEMAAATRVPVNADFQAGYADDPEGVARNVARCVGTGVAGLSIEDSTSAGGLYERGLAIDRIRAARAATGDVVLTARCEAFLLGVPDAARIVLDRLPAFAEAGADCLYAPGVRDPETIAAIVKAVAPRPVNMLVGSPGLTVAQLAALGVRRISVGGALARAAWGGFVRAAREIAAQGTFGGFADATPFSELEKLFSALTAA